MSALQEVVALSHAGVSLRFYVPSPIVRSHVERLLTREPTTPPWIRSFAPHEVFIDVGANIGLYSIYASVLAGSRVYSFEPEAQNYAELNKNIFINGLHERVTAYCVALTDHSALASLYLCTFAVGRMRNGGRQVVTVQHVNISGGQAIVAGAVSATGGAFAGGDHDSAQ
jgi:Met-10+ like-protein